MFKLIALVCAASALVSATIPADEPANIDYNAIVKVVCGGASGTAFWIDDTRLLTAVHVTRNGPCSIDGNPVRIVREEEAIDVAELEGPNIGHHLHLNCRAFHRGHIYHAAGFAFAHFRHTSRLIGTGYRETAPDPVPAIGMAILRGQAYPGMSGGPVFDRRGNVVGMTNRGSQGGANPTFESREIRESAVCRA
jgi:hypothetical protein